MRAPFSLDSLLTWVVGYLVCAFLPGLMWFVLPDDVAAARFHVWEEQTVQVGQVLAWFPLAMCGAAAVTLVTGLTCGALNAASVRVAARGDEPGASPNAVRLADTTPSLFSAVRVALMLAGIAFVILSVALTWLSITKGDLSNEIAPIIVALGGGAGLATGAAFYRD
ncbi:MAG: hypothetical protein ACKODX_03860 [Gemmata sp.]